MHNQLKKYIEAEELFVHSDKILLTVSGGVDSVVMAELFYKAGFDFAIAHCNFQLRGEESDGDERFVAMLAEKYNVPFYTKQFDTSAHAKNNKVSIQVSARELRYNWFEELRVEFHYDHIATAHHQNDSIETFFINLIRGTGIAGLHGVLAKNGFLVRPLLFLKKKDIELYANDEGVSYRSDSSNASDKYIRNNIRHHIVPGLQKLSSAAEDSIITTIEHLKGVERIYKNDIEHNRKMIVISSGDETIINIKLLKQTAVIATYLYEFLKPFNFSRSVVEEIVVALETGSGKQFLSPTHLLLKDRDTLVIQKNKQKENDHILILEDQKKVTVGDLSIEICCNATVSNEFVKGASSSSALLDFDKLKFPLTLRHWKEGDYFHPLGMKGRKKKLSDFFIDNKLTVLQKKQVWLLCSDGEIVWVVGKRIDNRFRIQDKTHKIYILEAIG